ncbi:MAG: flagellar protein export ATPase FliI [Sulfuricurvum sp.]|uniref:flagellar protein export ATPase FliI n=1 Tax=Sulfuricurvum sp. TaxID=2025608 RepID=UPI002605D3F0|nr:flagellar protein export ATPase FliI [Sulfuricurvum sp.]MDD5160686.1 flagellar protein export ATPase FliI [Sulfuricurvum sp.]
MPLKALRSRLGIEKLTTVFGTVTKISPTVIVAEGLHVSIGDTVMMISEVNGAEALGMVSEVERNRFFITPFRFIEGFRAGDKVYPNQTGMMIEVGDALLGRVVDPFMNPIDGKGPVAGTHLEAIIKAPIAAMKRGMIDEPFSVGVKTIDGLLTCGKGQKLGIFAGSGVGKSTLMGMIVRGADAPIKVVALIGERGREVPEFIEKSLGGNLENTVLVVATSDDSPLMRKYGAFSAMSVAEYFKGKGHDVLFMMDSVTRFAMAQREIGLALGEPPTSKGYPPSSLTLLPQLMERAGKEEGNGSITAFFTVLVEGDDLSDPIADQSRSILDGHIVLSRELTDFGIYPPIHILNSASRVMNDIISPEHLAAVRRFRRLYTLLKENEMLIRIGAYVQGTDRELDEAMAKKAKMEAFLSQESMSISHFQETVDQLIALMGS